MLCGCRPLPRCVRGSLCLSIPVHRFGASAKRQRLHDLAGWRARGRHRRQAEMFQVTSDLGRVTDWSEQNGVVNALDDECRNASHCGASDCLLVVSSGLPAPQLWRALESAPVREINETAADVVAISSTLATLSRRSGPSSVGAHGL